MISIDDDSDLNRKINLVAAYPDSVYVAISHVWSGGLGNVPGTHPEFVSFG